MVTRRRRGVKLVPICPVLVNMSPGVAPVVKDLAAQQMAPHAPIMAPALGGQMLPPGLYIVDVADLPGQVVESGYTA